MTTRSAEVRSWLEKLLPLNEQWLFHPPLLRLRWIGARDPIRMAKYLLTQYRSDHILYAQNWYPAMTIWGIEWAHRISDRGEYIDVLARFFDRCIDTQGHWKSPLRSPAECMKGYTLLYLCRATGEKRYATAACDLVDFLLECPRSQDGTLEYVPGTKLVLVDTLGMVCPLLARAGAVLGSDKAIDLGAHLLARFSETNLDPGTSLPFHGYLPHGPKRLGLHGWGRGVGWYMLGMADWLAETPANHPLHAALATVFRRVASSVVEFQRPNGHWNWSIALCDDAGHCDSSATAMIGYSLLQGVQ